MAAPPFDRIPFEGKKKKKKVERNHRPCIPARLYIKLVGRLREINLIKDAEGLREPRRAAGFEATWIDAEDGGAERVEWWRALRSGLCCWEEPAG